VELPSPEYIPPLITFLCGDDAGYINGQVFAIHGNEIAIYSQPRERKTVFKESGWWTVDELVETIPSVLLAK